MPIPQFLLDEIQKNHPPLTILDFKNIFLITKDFENLKLALKSNTVVGHVEWHEDNIRKHKKEIDSIEEFLIRNNQAYRDRPSDYEYAMLSEHVYNPLQVEEGVSWQRTDGTQLSLPDWKILQIFTDEKNGYYAAAYYHPKFHFIVLAHRGSDLPFNSLYHQAEAKDLNTDIQILYNKISVQQIHAYAAAKELTELANQYDWQFSTTGHSLGGWLAQLTVLHCHLDFNYPQAYSVSFDNFGIEPMFDRLEKGNLDRLKRHRLDMTVYLSVPNVINASHKHVGQVFRLLAKNNEFVDVKHVQEFLSRQAIPDFLAKKLVDKLGETQIVPWLATIKGHSIEGIVDCFNPDTGIPDQLEVVHQWPLITWHEGGQLLQEKIKEKIESLHEKHQPQLNTWFDQGIQWAAQYMMLGAGLPAPVSKWIADQVGNKLGKYAAKALGNYVQDLQIVQSADFFYHFYAGNVDKEVYENFLKLANATNNYHPDASALSIYEQYTLRYEATYQTVPYDKSLLSLSHFHPDLYRVLKQSIGSFSFSQLPNRARPREELLPSLPAVKVVEKRHRKYVNLTDAGDAREFRRRLIRFSAIQSDNFKQAFSPQMSSAQPSSTPILDFLEWKEELITYYQQQDCLPDSFVQQGRPIEKTYITLELLSEASIKEKEREMRESKPDRKYEKFENRDIQHHSSADEIYMQSTQSVAIADIFKQNPGIHQHVSISGEPGVGKTTFCHYATYQWAKGELWDEYEWVFWIPLRQLNNKERYPANLQPYNWADIVAREIFHQKLDSNQNKAFREFLQPAIEANKVLFILDGYDEIAVSHEESWGLSKTIDELLKMPQYLVTSRFYATGKIEKRFNVKLQVIGFTHENIDAYVQQFFLEDAAKAKRLQAFLKQYPGAIGIARIPFNLELLCLTWKAKEMEKTPSLTELYHTMVTTFLKRELIKSRIESAENYLEADVWHYFKLELNVLARLAFESIENDQVIINSKTLQLILNSFLKENPDLVIGTLLTRLENLGILKAIPHHDGDNPLQSDHYFVHKTFQEFFTARYIARWFVKEPSLVTAKALVANYKYAPNFEVVWWFVAGLLTLEADTNPQPLKIFFHELLNSEPIDLIASYSRLLAIRCLDETRFSQHLLNREEIIKWIINGFNRNEEFLVAATRKILNSPFILNHQLVRKKLFEVATTHPTTKFIETLDLHNHGKPEAVSLLIKGLNHPHSSVRNIAVFSLSRVPMITPEIISALITALYDEDSMVCLSAAVALGNFGEATEEIVSSLEIALTLKDSAYGAAQALGKLGHVTPNIINPFILNLKHSENRVREDAAEILGAFGQVTPEIITALLTTLQDRVGFVRNSAVQALWQLGHTTPEIIRGLVTSLKDPKRPVRASAASALGTLGQATPEVISTLATALLSHKQAQEFYETKQALLQLSQNKPVVIDTLRTLLKDRDKQIHNSAAWALAQLGHVTPEVIQVLIMGLRSPVEWMRDCAAKTLGELGQGTPRIVRALIIALEDHEPCVSAAQSLGKFGQATPQIISGLIKAMYHKNQATGVHIYAAEILGKLKQATPYVIDVLVKNLQNQNVDIRTHAARVLIELGQARLQVVDMLINDLKKPLGYPSPVSSFLSELGQTTPEVINALIKVTKKPENWLIQHTAELILIEIGRANPRIIKTLVTAFLESTLDALPIFMGFGADSVDVSPFFKILSSLNIVVLYPLNNFLYFSSGHQLEKIQLPEHLLEFLRTRVTNRIKLMALKDADYQPKLIFEVEATSTQQSTFFTSYIFADAATLVPGPHPFDYLYSQQWLANTQETTSKEIPMDKTVPTKSLSEPAIVPPQTLSTSSRITPSWLSPAKYLATRTSAAVSAGYQAIHGLFSNPQANVVTHEIQASVIKSHDPLILQTANNMSVSGMVSQGAWVLTLWQIAKSAAHFFSGETARQQAEAESQEIEAEKQRESLVRQYGKNRYAAIYFKLTATDLDTQADIDKTLAGLSHKKLQRLASLCWDEEALQSVSFKKLPAGLKDDILDFAEEAYEYIRRTYSFSLPPILPKEESSGDLCASDIPSAYNQKKLGHSTQWTALFTVRNVHPANTINPSFSPTLPIASELLNRTMK